MLCVVCPGIYTSSFDWRPTVQDKYTMELEVRDASGAKSTAKPHIVLCACQNDGVCDYSSPWGVDGTFAYAGCVCTAGRSGSFCQDDLNACRYNPCYGGTCIMCDLQ